MTYIIKNEHDEILSAFEILFSQDGDIPVIEWNGHYNDEGGYYSGALICNEGYADMILTMTPGASKTKVKEVVVYMEDWTPAPEPKVWDKKLDLD